MGFTRISIDLYSTFDWLTIQEAPVVRVFYSFAANNYVSLKGSRQPLEVLTESSMRMNENAIQKSSV